MKDRVRFVVSCGLLLGTLIFLHLRSSGEAVPLRKPFSEFPSSIGSWQLRQMTPLDQRTCEILKLTDYVSGDYADSMGRRLHLYVGYWDTQRKGAQIHSPKNCLPGSGWEPIEVSDITIPLSSPQVPIRVNRYLIRKDRDQLLVLYWYQSGGKVSAGEMDARVQMIKNSIFHNRSDGTIVRVSSSIYGDISQTEEFLVQYVHDLYPILGEYLPE